MRPTFLGFEASKSALYSAQKGLDITGNNLSNISTDGYTRQRIDQVSVNTANYASKYFGGTGGMRTALAGQGTSVIGVGQTRNKQLDTAFRNTCSDIGEYSQQNAMLTDIESALQEFDLGESGNGYGMRDAISQLYTSLQEFTLDTSSVTNATVVSAAFENIAQSLQSMSSALDDVSDKYKGDLQSDVLSVNTTLEEIGALNKSIKDAMIANGYTQEYGPNELLDQRNSLLDELATYGEMSIAYNNDGTVDVSLGGFNVVSGEDVDRLEYNENTDGTVSLHWKTTGEDANLGNGVIHASVNILNGRGANVESKNEVNVRGVLYYKDKLNTLATRLADVANNTIPDEIDAQGNVVSYKKLFGAQLTDEDGKTSVYPDMHIDASNIALTDDLKAGANYLLYDNGTTTENKYALELVAKLSSEKLNFGSFTGTFEDYITDYTTTLGNDVSYSNTRYEAAVAVGTETLNARDSTTGVSEVEETTNMLTYNRAFQAASRMMTTMDSLLDVIINQMGVS